MRLAVLANEELKEELLSTGINDNCEIDWVSSAQELSLYKDAHAVIDLLFEQNGCEFAHLKSFLPKPVFLNSINKTISEINFPCIRINAWPGFLRRNTAEACCNDEALKTEAEKILALLNRTVEFVPDIKGFISPRIVSMIINEAYFALDEKVSTKEEIDIAMKLGTNYPYGPFEWGRRIGLKKIVSLLTDLSTEEKRYQPASLLIKEAEK